MANNQVGSTQEILKNCTLTLDNHHILNNHIAMVIGSFNTIIGTNWLSLNHIEVLFFEKALRLPIPNHESLIVYGDKPGRNLRIISYMKAKKYL